MKKTVAIAGLGARGYDTYAKYQHLFPEKMDIVAVADIDPRRTEAAGKEFNIKDEMVFDSAEKMFAAGKLADCIFITTQDQQHLEHTFSALNLGYDILLEKPISTTLRDCLSILNKTLETDRFVLICHVLRYTAFYRTIKDIIESGAIGCIVSVQAAENVGYWHQSHSFVRGNWRKAEETSPMILQKCCHDFDIISWIIGKRCVSLNSYGSLKFFKEESAPEGSTKYCSDCPHIATCEYSAYNIYLHNETIGFLHGNSSWPCNIVAMNPTEDTIRKALKRGQYGRCVFRCDNNVVDHQTVNMLYEDGVTATLTMCAFTAKNSREIKIMGTCGEIIADQDTNIVRLMPFGKSQIIYDVNRIASDLSGHGGGDNAMLTCFFDVLNDSDVQKMSTIADSIQSHIMAFAAEESRLNGGKNISIDEFTYSASEALSSRRSDK